MLLGEQDFQLWVRHPNDFHACSLGSLNASQTVFEDQDLVGPESIGFQLMGRGRFQETRDGIPL